LWVRQSFEELTRDRERERHRRAVTVVVASFVVFTAPVAKHPFSLTYKTVPKVTGSSVSKQQNFFFKGKNAYKNRHLQ
jgi:hypothetical protein